MEKKLKFHADVECIRCKRYHSGSCNGVEDRGRDFVNIYSMCSGFLLLGEGSMEYSRNRFDWSYKDYKLVVEKSIKDGDTLADSHTGVDACMYNLEHNVIVLGEAKFYEKLSGGINKIISDLVEKSIKNKLESLQTKIENNDEAYKIVIKNLVVDEYEELTVNQFMNQRIIFAGFVLHSETDVSQYGNLDFYDKYFVSSQQLTDNIRNSLNNDEIEGDYEIVLVHLPVKDKKSLIVKVMEMSKDKLGDM